MKEIHPAANLPEMNTVKERGGSAALPSESLQISGGLDRSLLLNLHCPLVAALCHVCAVYSYVDVGCVKKRFCARVEAILVNIFGGIVNCAIIANGITKACRELELKVPLVVRLEGTNVHEAKRILSESGLPITAADDLDDAAKKAVAATTK
uniref:ATP-citrate synthase/succinyl-CoA ligase C-terminal domain-containing protein n=1 Tax=Knipowitschia caucasica TaxID=637954 RepID=A0AAV2M8W0_KNICA